MADLESMHLGLDENEADIAEELQDFDDSFDTRSEASETGSESSHPSISSVSTAPSLVKTQTSSKNTSSSSKRKTTKDTKVNTVTKKVVVHPKRPASPMATLNGKTKKKRSSNPEKIATEESEHKKKSSNEKSAARKTQKRKPSSSITANGDITTNVSGAAATVPNDATARKSDMSEAEDNKPAAPPFDSDTESENSDSAANIKRNGRKAASKSASPDKKSGTGGAGGGSGGGGANKNANNKSYDYMTKLNYLFRDTRFFLIKSNNADNIALSKSKNVWATLPQNDANLNQAFKEARNVLLIFSVNESGKFSGFARMSAQSRRDIPQVAWVLPPSISSKALGGVIELDWICRKELSFNCTSHLYNSWNEGKPVKIGRDGQEIEPKVGAELCRLFPEDEKVELTPILRKSKETAKMMREKGIRVIYKPPRSLSSRGGRGGSGGGYRHGDRRLGGDIGGGPMRHKRTYGGGPHRPYKMPPMGPGSFKRAASPYRSGPGGPGGGSRLGGGDAGLPPWERYMTTTSAAAEAYVADYMRNMHGQLPPLPFVPPFPQLPLSAVGSGGALPPSGPPSIYEQLPPPARYYDGPPLPDYPPPQPMRPPPPGFDKAPSYEDFAAWKNAGLPTVPGAIPPGFPGFSNSSLSASNGGGGGGGGGGSSGPSGSASSGVGSNFANSTNVNSGSSASGPNAYRNRENSNLNRSRERGGARDYHRGGGTSVGGSSRSGGGERDRHFRSGGGSERGAHRNYRDGRR